MATDDHMDEGEFAVQLGELLVGNLGDPARFIELHGWSVEALDIGEINIATRNDGAFRLTVSRFDPTED